MALLALELLSKSARLALPTIEGMVERGFSANLIQKSLIEAGIELRRTVLLDVVRQLRGNINKRPYLDSLRDASLPNPARLGAPLNPTLRDFSFKVEVRGINSETGEDALQYVTISSSTNLTKSMIKTYAMQMIEQDRERYQFDGAPGYLLPEEAKVIHGTFSGNL